LFPWYNTVVAPVTQNRVETVLSEGDYIVMPSRGDGRPAGTAGGLADAKSYERTGSEMPKAMTIARIRETFINEWVVVLVTRVDKADVPVAGEIVTHGPDKPIIYQAVQFYLTQHPTARLFIFFTGDPIPKNVEVLLGLSQPCPGTHGLRRSTVNSHPSSMRYNSSPDSGRPPRAATWQGGAVARGLGITQ